jgi:hypothetical protein
LIGLNPGITTIAAVHSQCHIWVKSPHYRAAALVSASPSISRPRQEGFNTTLCARKRHMQCSKTALLFDHVVCALLEKSSPPCSLDCAE